MFAELGHDAIHTLGLPLGNATPDEEIIRIAVDEDRMVLTKDSDFLDSFLLHGLPPRLCLVSTGNVSNAVLTELLKGFFVSLRDVIESASLLELTPYSLTIHY